MTTVLADFNARVMVADTGADNGEQVWLAQRKVWRSGKWLLGFAGRYDEIEEFLAWWRAGRGGPLPSFRHSEALAMSDEGLLHFSTSAREMPSERRREAIGTGAIGALCAYEALGWTDPKRAVRIACRHDAHSRAPVRVYSLRAGQ
mgnify:CR=1 FL=1